MSRSPAGAPEVGGGGQRLDKWLWFARVVRTRSLATALVLGGKVRVNRVRVDKPSQTVRPGDVVTVTVHSRVRVLKITAAGERRGSATIAQMLYEDLTPPALGSDRGQGGNHEPGPPQRDPGSGRPTKRERRAIERLTRKDE